MKKAMKFVVALGLVAIMGVSVIGCGGNGGNDAVDTTEVVDNDDANVEETGETDDGADVATGDQTVGVSMPTQDLQRWNQDGANVQEQLQEAGFNVDLQFANNDVGTQVNQIENMIAAGVDVLVIASIDGGALGTVLGQAKDAGIPVIAYDRLIMGTDAVSYYTTFDNYGVGQVQGQFIADALNLANEDGPFNIELFTGDPGDNNAHLFFNGALGILQPFIDDGTLVVQSGQTTFEQAATADWSPENAQNRMEAIIASHYADGTVLHAVLCSNDSTAQGVIQALRTNYTLPAGADWPVITGQDCDIANVPLILEGYQSMSIFKDTRALASAAVEMVQAILSGGTVPVNDTEQYDNGVIVVPTYLLGVESVTIDNWVEWLIDTEYYTWDQLGVNESDWR
ncbi:MAG: sugar-binding protein [Lachnospiraceae bacterium]|nr:sugar-binding protein [Lachnospiraceae bacterium]